MGQNFHLAGVLDEVSQVQRHESPKLLLGIVNRSERPPRVSEKGLQGVALNQVEELLFARKIIVETGKADARGAGYVANGGAMVTARPKDRGRLAKYSAEHGVEMGGTADRHKFPPPILREPGRFRLSSPNALCFDRTSVRMHFNSPRHKVKPVVFLSHPAGGTPDVSGLRFPKQGGLLTLKPPIMPFRPREQRRERDGAAAH